MKEDEVLHSSNESEGYDLSPDSPNYYPLEELEKMTPDELRAIGYPNPEEFQ